MISKPSEQVTEAGLQSCSHLPLVARAGCMKEAGGHVTGYHKGHFSTKVPGFEFLGRLTQELLYFCVSLPHCTTEISAVSVC